MLLVSCVQQSDAWLSAARFPLALPARAAVPPLSSLRMTAEMVPDRWKRASLLDTTQKFDEVAAGASLAESAALQLGREPGTCDPYDPKSAEFCSPVEVEPSPFLSKRTLKLATLFGLWYFLNTAYNIGNKLVLTALPIPWTSATIELFFGLPYAGRR